MNNIYQVGDLLMPVHHNESAGYISKLVTETTITIESKNEIQKLYEVTWISKSRMREYTGIYSEKDISKLIKNKLVDHYSIK